MHKDQHCNIEFYFDKNHFLPLNKVLFIEGKYDELGNLLAKKASIIDKSKLVVSQDWIRKTIDDPELFCILINHKNLYHVLEVKGK